MRIREYLKDRVLILIANFILFIILCCIIYLFNMGKGFEFLFFCIWFLPLGSYIILELVKSKKYYDELEGVLKNLDRKYLLPEVVKEPQFIEGKIVYDLLKETCKDMHEHVNKYRDMQNEYREYIETWVHEVKTPIASSRLIIDNNENIVTKNIDYELKKIESYIEQVLYYSRSNNVSKDYIIKKITLNETVANVIKRNSRDFINKKISVDITNVEGTVYSDAKWLEFILNQIISNSIKYSKENDGKVTIFSRSNKSNVVLTIEDNGIGIIDRDINRVWEKGFTGENGRLFSRSTGIGLYLCKSLCKKLGLGISLTSQSGIGTKVSIIFPMEDFI